MEENPSDLAKWAQKSVFQIVAKPSIVGTIGRAAGFHTPANDNSIYAIRGLKTKLEQ